VFFTKSMDTGNGEIDDKSVDDEEEDENYMNCLVEVFEKNCFGWIIDYNDIEKQSATTSNDFKSNHNEDKNSSQPQTIDTTSDDSIKNNKFNNDQHETVIANESIPNANESIPNQNANESISNENSQKEKESKAATSSNTTQEAEKSPSKKQNSEDMNNEDNPLFGKMISIKCVKPATIDDKDVFSIRGEKCKILMDHEETEELFEELKNWGTKKVDVGSFNSVIYKKTTANKIKEDLGELINHGLKNKNKPNLFYAWSQIKEKYPFFFSQSNTEIEERPSNSDEQKAAKKRLREDPPPIIETKRRRISKATPNFDALAGGSSFSIIGSGNNKTIDATATSNSVPHTQIIQQISQAVNQIPNKADDEIAISNQNPNNLMMAKQNANNSLPIQNQNLNNVFAIPKQNANNTITSQVPNNTIANATQNANNAISSRNTKNVIQIANQEANNAISIQNANNSNENHNSNLDNQIWIQI